MIAWREAWREREYIRIPVRVVDRIWAEGERLLAEGPFPTGWEEWRPDPAWNVPELPAEWRI